MFDRALWQRARPLFDELVELTDDARASRLDEIGKEDPAYPGAQRFLATGSSPQFPLGPWYRVRVVQSGGTIQLFVNDLLITTVVDNDSPYTGGRIGLYTEDAESYFDNVVITTVAKGKKRR